MYVRPFSRESGNTHTHTHTDRHTDDVKTITPDTSQTWGVNMVPEVTEN